MTHYRSSRRVRRFWTVILTGLAGLLAGLLVAAFEWMQAR